jgi:hypothetical protein
VTSANGVRNWLFEALSVELLLDDLEADGVAVRATADPRALQRVIPLEDFSPEIRRSSMHALPVYLAFFCIENGVRELVSQRLLESLGAEWWAEAASEPLKKTVTERREKEGKNRWHVQRGAQEIYYTNFGDLASLIRNNWAYFEDLFPDQNWILQRLSELEDSRNVIAHSNLLEQREIERVRMYLQDWVRQVG